MFFFIVAPCILITLKFFSPTNAPLYYTYKVLKYTVISMYDHELVCMTLPTKIRAQRTDETLEWCNNCKQKAAFGHSECRVKEKCRFKLRVDESTSQY